MISPGRHLIKFSGATTHCTGISQHYREALASAGELRLLTHCADPVKAPAAWAAVTAYALLTARQAWLSDCAL